MAGRGNVTASTREAIQLVNVEMTVDDFVKWQKFKRMNLNKNSSMDAPPISASLPPLLVLVVMFLKW
jgi:hypothetical protein